MPIYINGYCIYDTPLNKPMYNKLFLAFNKYLREHSVIESYKGQKEEVAWKYVFDLQEIKELNISEEVKSMLLKSTVEKYQNEEDEVVVTKGKRKKKGNNISEEDLYSEDIIINPNEEDENEENIEVDAEEENVEEDII